MGLDYEQLLIFNELSEIIRWQNQCIERMKSFREKYPYLIPPNVARMVEENLKENVQFLYRELNHLHKPPEERRRHVCRECHGVFFVSLPGGLCDECRAKIAATHKPQYGRVAPPRLSASPAESGLDNGTTAETSPGFPETRPKEDDLAPKEDD
ncbi:MAG: hypothetical protein N2Z21_11270 [Candidatus Sumerlaeaceae bacterium]|nr:hypothetical protein [Candidatus Sumerlaeaceae bacterium]